jgi:hypothetical protein
MSVEKLTGSCMFNFNSAQNPHGVGIYNGASVALKLYLRDPSSQYYDLPIARVKNFAVASKVGPVTTFKFDWTSSGPYTRPTANF